jgi:hypothetical protein
MAAFSLAPTDSDLSTSDADTYNFTSQSLGSAPSGAEVNRYFVVSAGHASGDEMVAASVAGETLLGAELNDGAAWAILIGTLNPVNTGTSGTVSIEVTSTALGLAFSLFRLVDPEDPVPFDTESALGSGATANMTFAIPDGGGAVAVSATVNAGTTTWTNVTEVQDVDINSNEWMSQAYTDSDFGDPITVTATNADSTPGDRICAIFSWAALAPTAVGRSWGQIIG